MGLKKYEIITVRSDKRVRALRSWQVGDRYVNIGDVGGIVYDEKTLSQDGLCWLFRGDFGFPGARIGGDSIVDVAETTLSTTGTPAVDILGSSVVVGSKLQFASEQTAANAVTLTSADFEQGALSFVRGTNWETWKSESPNYLRTKAPIFMGGAPMTLKLDVPGYAVQAYVLDRDGVGITAPNSINTGGGVTLAVPAGQYMLIKLSKIPAAGIVPADATTAQIAFTGIYETKLSIIDSRVEINPATSTGTTIIRPGGTYTFASGAKYPEAIIRNSKVSMNVPAVTSRSYRIMGQIIESNATLDATAGDVSVTGQYSNINNLTASGVITSNLGVTSYSIIQVTDCDNFAVSPTIFPGLAADQTANMPFIFQGCNVPNGKFYHHAQIKNTYINIDFAKASADLGKTIASGQILASAEVEGMYRLYSTTGSVFGALVESHNSIAKILFNNFATIYNTTIYADAYLNGLFDLKGTNVFGNSMKHDASNTQDISELLVQGSYNTGSVGGVITGISPNEKRCVIRMPFRINGSKGFRIICPAGIECLKYSTDANGNIMSTGGGYATGVIEPLPSQLKDIYVYLMFRKPDDSSITPDDIKGVTVTTYNGCRIINTKAAAAVIAGNVRVEDNATLIDVSVTGTGYFGGNSVIQAPSDLASQLPIEGAAYMSDNAVFTPSVANASAGIALLDMKDNATFSGQMNAPGTIYDIAMSDNAQFLGIMSSLRKFIMRGNSFVAALGTVASACAGRLTMKDDARIENGSLTAIGHITLCGKYKQTAAKTWTGKRVIGSWDAPTYDDNVKTQYDF